MIDGNPTVSNEHKLKTAEPTAGDRLALMGQAANAKIEQDRIVASLREANGPILAEVLAQQDELGALIRDIATAGLKELPALKRAVATAIATAGSMAQQAQTAASVKDTPTLADLADASRRNVQSAMEYTSSLNLHFASADDERGYREREAERSAYIAAQQAKGTPVGDLNAAGGVVGQMADAAAHGAKGDPQFEKRWDALVDSTTKLRAQIVRDGGNVAEFDGRLREDLRRIMKSKGVADSEIDALLAAHPDNPLDAMKAFVAEQKGVLTEKDMNDFSRRATSYKDDAEFSLSVAAATVPQASIPASAKAAMADLKALGVVASAHDESEQPAHGVAAANAGKSAKVRS